MSGGEGEGDDPPAGWIGWLIWAMRRWWTSRD
jgi:hypothetical protein